MSEATIREHLNQQVAEIDYWLNGKQATFGNLGLLRILRGHAVAALGLLDAAPAFQMTQLWRVIPDPEAGAE